MKFSHQLKFNSVPEWREHYIKYAALKKIIYAIAKAEQDETLQTIHEDEHGHPLLQHTVTFGHDKVDATEETLVKYLDKELADIISFYMTKEAEILANLEKVDLQIHSLEKVPRAPSGSLLEVQASADGSETIDVVTPDTVRAEALSTRAARVDFWTRAGKSSSAKDLIRERGRLKSRISDTFVALHDLKNFLTVNKEGFRKILKKHDKLASSNLKATYWRVVEDKYPSRREEKLQRAIERVTDQYAVIYLQGDVDKATEQLTRKLRDQIKVERNTVWRDMVALERRHVDAVVDTGPLKTRAPWLVRHRNSVCLFLSVTVFAALLSVDSLQLFAEAEKQNCFAMLLFVSLLWATEAIPLFATSMLIPPLVVLLRLLVDRTKDPPVRLTAQEAAPAIFHAMFSQVIMLLLGGFAIASALSKHFIAKQLAIAVLSRVGRKPHNVILASMFVATFASMWISNVASPVLCFSLVTPILRTLDTNNPFCKALVMGIALASNVGGMTSPISSPQNIFAIERMSMDGEPPSWLSWFAVALPVSIVCNLLAWALILLVYRPWTKVQEVRPIKPNTDPMTGTQVFVIFISLLTVALWCGNSTLRPYVGEMGVVAVLPLAAFFGFGVLSKDDFNGFLWNVVMLAMGGLGLGEAVKSSGLLQSIAEAIQDLVEGMDLTQVMLVFCLMVLIATTFISHTVGAMVILPIVQSVGEQMVDPHPKLLVMATALMCSGAMGLPVSGFPNMNAVALEDPAGVNYVNTLDFIKVGVPSSVLAYGVIVSVGYALMLVVKF
mmetsp:Transcript_31205/g.69392  ORF Transcript_31205/g.69392 Transcript_31205/m.69392 type:complete len:781 (-) Transcript_31205:655-2997(-)|eukprot:CAMPEP_0202902370 /NCGR_PEP_ID=MMETSP1392-20130828/16813_1 /ASSEMBLY_ACC=CAM_ASM_000868 /TAXON_ID=225041 /ORGANISM="Chlamydomonas chlamydogama, Strain SAG 11-48b" /LENGTH=780 /DNA_ID=CAMNT_0049589123 /DNA_START=128 /DNA_END=2470 /DNA_ORIENTATION=+